MKTLQRHLPYPSGVSFVACNVWYDKVGFLLYRVSPENSFARLAAEFFLLLSTANISESYDKSQQMPNEMISDRTLCESVYFKEQIHA